MLWLLLLFIVYFVNIEIKYVYSLLMIVNFVQGVSYIKKNKAFFEKEIIAFLDEDGIYRYRGKADALLKAIYLSMKFWLLELINPFVILSVIYSCLLSMSYFKKIYFLENTILFKMAFFLFCVSEFSNLLGKMYASISFIFSKNKCF